MREAENIRHAMSILQAARAVLNSSVCQFVDTGIPDVSAKYNAIITSIGDLERYIEPKEKPNPMREYAYGTGESKTIFSNKRS